MKSILVGAVITLILCAARCTPGVDISPDTHECCPCFDAGLPPHTNLDAAVPVAADAGPG